MVFQLRDYQLEAAGFLAQKECRRCGISKPLEEFYRNQSRPDGRTTQCKECQSKYDAQYYNDHRDERIEYTRKYRAEHLDECRAREAVVARRNRVVKVERWRQRRNDDLELIRAQDNARYDKNPGPRLAAVHKRRARKLGADGSHTHDEFVALCKVYNGRCFYCGSITKLTEDHIVPLSRGGSDYINNIVPACKPCNSRKGMLTLHEYARKCDSSRVSEGGI